MKTKLLIFSISIGIAFLSSCSKEKTTKEETTISFNENSPLQTFNVQNNNNPYDYIGEEYFSFLKNLISTNGNAIQNGTYNILGQILFLLLNGPLVVL